MLKTDAYEGQWVRFLTTDTKHQFEGFIRHKRDEYARVAIPSIQATRSIPYPNLIDNENVKQDESDIDELIEIALSVKDEKWFQELMDIKGVMNQWK